MIDGTKVGTLETISGSGIVGESGIVGGDAIGIVGAGELECGIVSEGEFVDESVTICEMELVGVIELVVPASAVVGESEIIGLAVRNSDDSSDLACSRYFRTVTPITTMDAASNILAPMISMIKMILFRLRSVKFTMVFKFNQR